MKKLGKNVLLLVLTLSMILGFTFFNAMDTRAAATKKVYLGKYTLTAYCPCRSCSGGHGRNTASGKKATAGRTIAVDTRKIKLGTKISINGHTYTAEDVGGAIKGNKIDIYFASHKAALKFGRKKNVKVYKVITVTDFDTEVSEDDTPIVTDIDTDVTLPKFNFE